MSLFPYPLVWPPLSEELAPFLKYCKGIVLNAGSGNREIQLGQRDLGIDIDPNNNPDIVADLHRIPLRDESVDTIVSIAVLEHTRYAWIVAQEFYRVLRAGGFGVIAVPFLQPQHACPHDFVRFIRNGLTGLMEYVGFEVVETKSVHHFGQTLAWLLWEYLQDNQPWKITWPFWYHLINQLSKGRLLGKDSPNTHNTEYMIVRKPGDRSVQQHHYLEALSNPDSQEWFFPLLSCPQSRQPLHYQGDCLVSADGRFTYSFKDGKPYLFPSEGEFRIQVNPSENFAPKLVEPQVTKFAQKLGQSRNEANPIEPSTQTSLSYQYELSNILSEKSFTVHFQSLLSALFSQSNSPKVAVLATTEYEGIFKNGGVGTYYKNLAKTLASDGWYLILLLCDSDASFIERSNYSELNHIFSTSEIEKVLNLQPVHFSILSETKQQSWFDYQSFCCLFFVQAIMNHFKNSWVYVEFHEMSGIGYRTIQAKQARCLSSNCQVAVTMHSGHEWIYEANEKYTHDYLDWLWQVFYYEQYCFENADLAFFPSHYLKGRVESYGWKTFHAKHMPYFVPIIPINTFLASDGNDEISYLVGMTSPSEREYLQNYAKNDYTGQGEIVDLGCWLGSLTIPLVIGLQENTKIEHDRVYIHAYDIFKWESWMEQCVQGTYLENKYQDGDSFLDAFLEQTHPWQHQIKVYQEDLTKSKWDKKCLIEFLIIDAMKSWDLTNTILRNFFPALIPGLSLIQHQDFVHYYTSWIHLIMYRLRDYFSPVIYVPFGSMIFQYQKKIPQEILQKSYSFQEFSCDEINKAFAYSSQIVPPEARPNIAAAKIMLYIHLGDIEQAQRELKSIKDRGVSLQNNDLEIIEKLILSEC